MPGETSIVAPSCFPEPDHSNIAIADRGEPANGMPLLGVDLLTLAIWPHDLPPFRDFTDDPMLEEFAASLAASRIDTRPPADHLASSLVATHLEVAAKAVVTYICTCGHQTLSQLADSKLRTPPLQPTQWVVVSPPQPRRSPSSSDLAPRHSP